MGKTLEDVIEDQERLNSLRSMRIDQVSLGVPGVPAEKHHKHLWEWMRRWPQFWQSPRQKCRRCGAMMRFESRGRRKGRIRLYKPKAGAVWLEMPLLPPCTGPRSRRRR